MGRLQTVLAVILCLVSVAHADEWWVLTSKEGKVHCDSSPPDILKSPASAYEATNGLGWSPSLIDLGDEVRIRYLSNKITPKEFRYFRAEAACRSALQEVDR